MNQVPFAQRELYDKGIAALQKNNFDYAITLFCTLLKTEPGFYEAREALRATQHKRAGGKTSFFKKFVGSASSLTRGQVALRSNPLEALQIAEDALNDDPGNASAHELLASAALAAGFPKTALLSLEVAFKHKPSDRKLALELVTALTETGNRGRAEKILRDLLQADPHDAALNEKLKNLLATRTMDENYSAIKDGQGSYRDIIRDKQEAVTLEQENRSVKDVDVAERLIADYERRLAAEGNNLKLMRDLADLHRKKQDFAPATAYYERIITTSGINDPLILQAIRDTRAAEFDHLQQSLDKNAQDYDSQLADLKARRYAWQLEDTKRRADMNPSDLHLRFELGELYLNAGKVGEAIAELQKAQNNPNKRIPAMNLLAQAFAKRGMNDLAARKFQEALKEKLVFDDEAKELRYQLGCVLEKSGKPAEALEQFKQIYEQDIGYRDVMAKVDAYYASQG
jgi:predicted Zn-dependent protease